MKDFAQMLKQAQAMQAKMAELQEQLEALLVDGQAGGGLVRMTVDGKGMIKTVVIDPSLLAPDDAEVLGDLIAAAYSDARGHAEEAAQQKMAALGQEMGLPSGLKMPL
ncbi:MAG: YbaB/EbfC family nucleoid-associated protein [Sphingomonadales bacterium]